MARYTRAGKAHGFDKQVGSVYLLLLFLITFFSLSLAVTGSLWSIDKRREQETQLQFVGDQYCKAIRLYYLSTPGTQKRYPAALTELLQDNRFVTPRRYLRRLYLDPITQAMDWGLVRGADGGIIGLYSQSDQKPLKGDPINFLSFRQWIFYCKDGVVKF